MKNIEAITISTDKQSDEFVVHVPLEYDYLYTTPRRKDIIKAIQSIYHAIKNAPLPIYGVPHRHLKECRTSTSDKKKGVSKMPDKNFLLQNYGIYEIVAQSTSSTVPSEKENEFLGFELLENDMSMSLYQKNMDDKSLKLEDLNILKMLGKGSFGKVYLVERKDNKQIYAMKSMRKDLLIRTDQVEASKLEKNIMKSVIGLLDEPPIYSAT